MPKRVWSVPGVTTRMIDGDSWWMDLDLGWYTHMLVPIRLNAVDAAGKGEPVRKEQATLFMAGLLMPGGVGVECGVVSHGKYTFGRTLADVTLPDGSDLGRALVASGLGVPWDGTGAHPPGGGA